MLDDHAYIDRDVLTREGANHTLSLKFFYSRSFVGSIAGTALTEPIHAFGAAHRIQVIMPWLGGFALLVVGTVMRLTLPIPVLPVGLLAFLSAYSFEHGATRIAALCIGLALVWCIRSIADSAQ